MFFIFRQFNSKPNDELRDYDWSVGLVWCATILFVLLGARNEEIFARYLMSVAGVMCYAAFCYWKFRELELRIIFRFKEDRFDTLKSFWFQLFTAAGCFVIYLIETNSGGSTTIIMVCFSFVAMTFVDLTILATTLWRRR